MEVIHWPAAEVFGTMKRVAAAAEKISDPLDRARALEVAGANVPELQKRIRRARATAIDEALESSTVTAVAAELGISRARLYQVLSDLED